MGQEHRRALLRRSAHEVPGSLQAAKYPTDSPATDATQPRKLRYIHIPSYLVLRIDVQHSQRLQIHTLNQHLENGDAAIPVLGVH